jgi:hypothetical protein
MAREVPAKSNRDTMRRLQRQDALGLFAAHKLQIPSKETLGADRPGSSPGLVQATGQGEEAIVEYEGRAQSVAASQSQLGDLPGVPGDSAKRLRRATASG